MENKITVRKINKAIRDTNYSLYFVGKERNFRVMNASKGMVSLIGDSEKDLTRGITDDMKFMDGRNGQAYYV